MNTKILNFKHTEHWLSKHRTFRTSHFGPKSNFEHVEHHKNNIKLYVPRIVWSHNNRPELGTHLNITFWPKTELRTCWTSHKTEQFTNIKLFVPRLTTTETWDMVRYFMLNFYGFKIVSLWSVMGRFVGAFGMYELRVIGVRLLCPRPSILLTVVDVVPPCPSVVCWAGNRHHN